jgi:hypothetical protein
MCDNGVVITRDVQIAKIRRNLRKLTRNRYIFRGRDVGKSMLVQTRPQTAPIAADGRSSQGELMRHDRDVSDGLDVGKFFRNRIDCCCLYMPNAKALRRQHISGKTKL